MLRKLRNHLRLLRDDPGRFAANLQQFTNPAAFRDRLLDVLTAPPLHVRVDDTMPPAVNVLRPPLRAEAMTGGPNTVVNLAFWLAMQDVPVRLIAAPPGPGTQLDWFWRHLASVTGETTRPAGLTVATAHNPANPLPIGRRDVFLATHWTTAQRVKELLPQMAVRRCFYLIQDFEPGFYPWSSNHALALETYALDHIGIFNEQLLFDYVREQQPGRYADAAFAADSLVFEPAIDRTMFHPPAAKQRPGPRRLLFYARPTNERNMLGLGLAALQAAIGDAAFSGAPWEFLAIGGRGGLPVMPLRSGAMLRPAPWADYASYARLLQESDILLCPMLSPHTSYAALEMAACGGLVVTNSFATKTAARLAAISPNIIAVAPTETGFTQGLIAAAARVGGGRDSGAPLTMPADWRTALSPTAAALAQAFRQMTETVRSASPHPNTGQATSSSTAGTRVT